MATFSSSVQYGQVPFQFINGFGIQNDPYTPNNLINIFYGRTLDSTYTYQLVMEPTILFIDLTISGIGGIDNGILLPNKVYALYVAWDTVGSNSVSAFMSSSYYHPLIPYGYNAVKLVGYAATDGSSNFRQAKWTPYGSSSYRNMIYTPSVSVLSNGTAGVQTNVNLISYIPNISGGHQIANLQLSFTSSTPGNSLTVYSEMGNFQLHAQSANIPNTSFTNIIITQQINIGGVISPIICYSVTNSSTDSASIYCNGYDFFL